MTDLEREIAELEEIIKFGRHNHVSGNNGDICRECGHDLRHIIHFRVNDEKNINITALLPKLVIDCPECKCIPNCEYYGQCDFDQQRPDYCPVFNLKSTCNCKGTGKQTIPIHEVIDKTGKVVK